MTEGKQVTIYVYPEDLALLDRMATLTKVSRSEALRQLIRYAAKVAGLLPGAEVAAVVGKPARIAENGNVGIVESGGKTQPRTIPNGRSG